MPTNTAPSRSFRRTLAAAIAALLLSAGGLLVASPASAHDELISSDPVAGAALDALPEQLTLTFSGELSTDPGATELQVTDAEGLSLAEGDPLVAGTVVTQPLSGAASGPITVLWKVVSSDGHPISGELAFTVTAPPTPTPTATPTASATPTEEPTEDPTPVPVESAVPVDSGAAAVPAILFAVLGVAILAAITYLLVSRARRRKALEESRPDAGGTGPGDAPASPSSPSSPPPADR